MKRPWLHCEAGGGDGGGGGMEERIKGCVVVTLPET